MFKIKKELREMEREFMLPHLEGKFKHIVLLLEKLVGICDSERNNKTLGSVLISMYTKMGQAIPANPGAAITDVQAANLYFDGIKEMLQNDYLKTAKKLSDQAASIKDSKSFSLWMNEAAMFATTILSMKETPYVLESNFFFTKHDKVSGEFVGGVPFEYEFILTPFKNTNRQIESIASSLKESVTEYVKAKLAWKTEEYEIKNKSLGLWLQIITVVFAIVISFAFTVLAEPLKAKQIEINYERVSKEVQETNSALINSKLMNEELSEKVSTLRKNSENDKATSDKLTSDLKRENQTLKKKLEGQQVPKSPNEDKNKLL